jgi:subtilisin family serine protease
MNTSPEGGQSPSQGGVLPEQEGVTLLRGGEELPLQKMADRFTVRPGLRRSLATLSRSTAIQHIQPVPGLQLTEVEVTPDQLEATMQQARQSDDVAFASHVYQLQDSPGTLVYLTDQITVQFARGVDGATMQALANSVGARILKPVEGIDQAIVLEVTKQATTNPIKLANQLMRHPLVRSAEPNIAVRHQLLYRPQDTLYPKQWYLQNQGGTDLASNSHISVEGAWDITRGDRSIVVAVIDDGFDLNHPDFQGKGKIVAPKDFQDMGFVPMPEAEYENHGTAVAGLAIAEETGDGIVGVAPGCSLMPIRSTGYLDDESIEQMFGWAITNGAAVITCSWGAGAVYFPLSMRQSAAITRAVTQGRGGKGAVVVFAAGNSNRPVNGKFNERGWPDNQPSGLTDWMNGFAAHPDVITVAASTSLSKKAAYSNWGSQITVCAPGDNAHPKVSLPTKGLVKTCPEITQDLPGLDILSSDRLGEAGYGSSAFDEGFGGTSAACPLVAGVAALVLSVNPTLSAQEVKQILQNTADKIVDSGLDPQSGSNYGSYDTNGQSLWFGYGKVNAQKAVRAAQQRLTAAPTVNIWLRQENGDRLNIPDDSAEGVMSVIQINQAAIIKDLRVQVDLEHGFLGDVEVSLIAPSGQTVLLQGRSLGRQLRLSQTYTPANTPGLKALFNQSGSGQWKLWLTDQVPQNVGWLNRWQLEIGL